MSTRLTRIATDGLSYLSTERVEKYRIVVIPRVFKSATKIYVSDHHNCVRQLNRRLRSSTPGLKLQEPELRLFLPLYQRVIADGRTIVSIHVARPFGGAAHEAKMAHRMLDPEAQIEVFESSVPGFATGFMVEFAARFVDKQAASAEEVITLLRRVQGGMRVFIATGDPAAIPGCRDQLTGSQLANRVVGSKALIELGAGGSTTVIGQSRDVARLLRDSKDRFDSVRGPGEILLRCFRAEAWVKEVANYLARNAGSAFVFKGVGRAGLEAAYLPADGVEIVFLPAKAQLTAMADFARKWGR